MVFNKIGSIHFISNLQNLVIDKARTFHLTQQLDDVSKLVYAASASVLKDLTPYLEGTKHLTEKQLKLISKEFDRLRVKLQEKAFMQEKYLSKKAERMETMIQSLRKNTSLSAEERNENYYQVMGCNVSYQKWQEGDKIPGPLEGSPDYKVERVIKNKKGLQIVVLVPDPQPQDRSAPPIFCCRGTTSNMHNYLDDLNEHIGEYSLTESRDEIQTTLTECAERYGAAVIAGHSLGGAVAQQMAAEFCDLETNSGAALIKEVHHFGAPGVGEKVASKYDEKYKKLDDTKKPRIYAYYHPSDIVPLAGGSHLRADVTKQVGKRTLSLKTAHCWSQTVFELGSKEVPKMSPLRRSTKALVEDIRSKVSFVFKRVLLSKLKAEASVKNSASKLSGLVKTHFIEHKKIQE